MVTVADYVGSGKAMKLDLDNRITCPREGCEAQASVRRPARLVPRLDGWVVVCDDGHTSWEPEDQNRKSEPAA